MTKSWKTDIKVIGYLFKVLFLAIILVTICMQLKVYSVKGNSMSGTIEEGDFIIINRISSKIGDVVVLKKDNQIFVKRLLATEGNLLLIDDEKIETGGAILPHDPVFNTFQLNYNKEELACYKYVDLLNRNVNKSKLSLESKAVIVNDGKCRIKIPESYNFVVGDNYYESMDSRFWGFIHTDEILGIVIAVF